MPHVFVETNWLFAYAAPAHHQLPAATALFRRAEQGEFTIHLPNICIGEARQAILTKCQPRKEADAIRKFLAWSQPAGHITPGDAAATRGVLDKYERSIKKELDYLDKKLREISSYPFIQIFGLDEAMLNRATELALSGVAPKPFDHAILAAILVRAERLWEAGEQKICFCEADADLQPWDKHGNERSSLKLAYDQAHIQVYDDFTFL